MKENQIFLFGHAGSRNHGCEAIVRSTCKLFNSKSFILFSHEPEEDMEYSIHTICRLLQKNEIHIKKFSVDFLKAYYALKVKKDYEPLNDYFGISAMRLASPKDIAFSIGGDNYCYSGVRRFMLYRNTLEKQGVKTVLWGCSVEPGLIDDEMRKDLSRYDLITARESITYETLCKINPNTVLAPDPAFTLERQPGKFPEGLGARPYIGLNVSPLVQNLEKSTNITMENYRALVRHILSDTDCDIALIPHVVWEYNDDRIPLGQLYNEFKDTGRVFMVEDQNCMQLKDIISGCEFFVGARTHTTIAAYSTCVPTLVVGYSVKARGIARDLFGTEYGYVLPVQELVGKDDLTNAFKPIYARKNELRSHLTDMMPGYIEKISIAKEAVERLSQ